MTASTTTVSANVMVESSSASSSSSCSPSYYAIVVDSGPIIKHATSSSSSSSRLFTASGQVLAKQYVTVPGVISEIRDVKSRQFLNGTSAASLFLDKLKVKQPTKESTQQIIDFAKQTGDFTSLSMVDIQVLALTLDLEKEGCCCRTVTHIRTTPKRKIGLGTIQLLNNSTKNTQTSQEADEEEDKKQADGSNPATAKPLNIDYDIVEEGEEEEDDDDDGSGDDKVDGNDDYESESDDDGHQRHLEKDAVDNNKQEQTEETTTSVPTVSSTTSTAKPKSWAKLVHPTATKAATSSNHASTSVHTNKINVPFGSMNIGHCNKHTINDINGGQFDDAIEGSQMQFDETNRDVVVVASELELDFPSLHAAATVPYVGVDDSKGNVENYDDDDSNNIVAVANTKDAYERTEEEKLNNLKPRSKSGKLYNSFTKYKDLMMTPKPKTVVVKKSTNSTEVQKSKGQERNVETNKKQESKILHSNIGETMLDEEDDGDGWITSVKDIQEIKIYNGGSVDPNKSHIIGNIKDETYNDANPRADTNSSNNPSSNTSIPSSLPSMSQRTACATTDFAMQNVLLQMDMILLSVDGLRIRRLKSWVVRCGACYKIHSMDDSFLNGRIKRLFCSHCGSGDMMQRISATVDGKTGRLKLHFSKRKQGKHLSTRGTKFSLPKPGSGNRFQGDLLLREDQLLTGAWNQKVKIRSGNAYQKSHCESMFGKDIASTVGCNVKTGRNSSFGSSSWTNSVSSSNNNGTLSAHDIKVGFGQRKNPNASKGRERRGKKKKSSDRACGLRRY